MAEEEKEGREVARRQAAGDVSASFNASTCSVPADLWPCHRQPGSPAAPGGSGVTVVPCAAGQLLLLSAATCQPRRGAVQGGRGCWGAPTCTARQVQDDSQVI